MVKKKHKEKNKYLEIGNFRIKKKIVIILACLIVAVIAFILFRTSYLWPWPSQSEIDQRLVEVVDGCIYNEDSRACKNLQSRYNMDFEYCYALSDIPEIGTLMPIYGVAKKKGFIGNSLSWESRHELVGYSPGDSQLEGNIKRAKQERSVYPYYGCTKTLNEIKKQNGNSLISNPNTIALFGLSNIPQYSETYEPNGQFGCTFHRASINNLWKQIPNISVIKNEADNIFNMYPKCNMRAEIDRSINELNTKLSDYANNYSVQLFFQKYDEWNMSDVYTCKWYDREFKQRCGAGSDDSVDVDVHNKSMLKDFTSEMHDYLHTEYFTSKIVVTD